MRTLIENIKNYNETKEYDDFDKIENEFVFYVDWREFDDAIVEYCETCIKTGCLEATINEDEILSIIYEGKNYKEKITDSRDTTLRYLNKVLLPKYEIRFCSITFPSDTLGFMILSTEKWKEIESEIPKKELDKLFEPIKENSKMFDREFEFEIDDD